MAIDCTNCTANAWTDNSPQLADPISILDQVPVPLATKFTYSPVSPTVRSTEPRRVYDSNANTWSTRAEDPAASTEVPGGGTATARDIAM